MSKLGLQSQSGIIQDASKLLAKHPIAYKLLGNSLSLDFARKIRAESPGTLIILRSQPDNWQLSATFTNSYIDRATKAAEPFLKEGLCDLLESPNEPPVDTIEQVKMLNELQVTVGHAYFVRGFTPLGYQMSVGQPDYGKWPYLEDGILACNGWVGLHEYGAVTLQSHAEDLSLRHRKVYALLSPKAQAKFRVIISECGLDYGIRSFRTLPDGFPIAGGYRAMPQVGDSENYWIKTFTDQLSWWDAELAKDHYIVACTLYGYAMEHPWETFDISAIDTDRSFFINWYQGGSVTPIPPIPPESPMITPAQTIATIPFLVKRAIQLDLGPSIYGEYDTHDSADVLYHGWVWQRGGVIVKDGDYGSLENAKLFNPQTGQPMAEPLPWPGGNPIPPTPPVKRLTTADLPPEYGIVVQSYVPKVGERFFGLVAAGPFLSGPSVGTQTSLMAVNEQGSPVIGYFLTHAWDDKLYKSETFASPSVGIILSTGSYYNPPALGPDHFYVSKGPSVIGVWPLPYPSDIVIGGMPFSEHFTTQYTWQLMTG